MFNMVSNIAPQRYVRNFREFVMQFILPKKKNSFADINIMRVH